MATQTHLPTVGANDARIGTNLWTTNLASLGVDDNVRVGTDNLNNSEVSQYLRGSAFGFTVSDTDVIDRIVLEVKRYAVGGATVDAAVRLVLADDSLDSEDKKLPGIWPTAAPGTIATYEWLNPGLVGADVNSAPFGAAVAVTNPSTTNSSVRVDFYRITIDYHPAEPPPPPPPAAFDFVVGTEIEVTATGIHVIEGSG